LTDRLLEADPFWFWEPLAFTDDGLPRFDDTGGLWIKLTVGGVSRLGYGHAETKSFQEAGARLKEVIGDALRNAGMRFGCALDLWHKGDLHAHLEANGALDNLEPPKTESHAPAGNGVGDVSAAIKAAIDGNNASTAAFTGKDKAPSIEPVVNPVQFKALNKLLDDAGADKEAFCAFFNVSSVAALPKSRFVEANQMLTKKIKNKAQGEAQ
jgi:hypothetical protein